MPIGLAGVLLVRRYIPDVHEDEVPPLDLRGFLLAAVALASMVFGFESMGRGLLPASLVIALLTTGAACAALYVYHARRIANPIIDLSLMRFPTFAASITGGSLFYMGTSSSVFLLAVLLQVGFGLSAFQAGLTTLAIACGTTTSRFVVRPILQYVGFKHILIVNACVTGCLSDHVRIVPPHHALCAHDRRALHRRTFAFDQLPLTSLSYAEMPQNLMSAPPAFRDGAAISQSSAWLTASSCI